MFCFNNQEAVNLRKRNSGCTFNFWPHHLLAVWFSVGNSLSILFFFFSGHTVIMRIKQNNAGARVWSWHSVNSDFLWGLSLGIINISDLAWIRIKVWILWAALSVTLNFCISSVISLTRPSSQQPCEVFLYPNSLCELQEGLKLLNKVCRCIWRSFY